MGGSGNWQVTYKVAFHQQEWTLREADAQHGTIRGRKGCQREGTIQASLTTQWPMVCESPLGCFFCRALGSMTSFCLLPYPSFTYIHLPLSHQVLLMSAFIS